MTDPRVEPFLNELRASREFFDRSSSSLTEADAASRPTADMLSTAEQFAHVAMTVDWFLEGAFGKGFDMDFEAHTQAMSKCTTVEQGRKLVAEAFQRALDKFAETPFEELATPLPAGPVMGGAPRFAIVSGISDHTAHHRGALTVYARLAGRTPQMPYMDT